MHFHLCRMQCRRSRDLLRKYKVRRGKSIRDVRYPRFNNSRIYLLQGLKRITSQEGVYTSLGLNLRREYWVFVSIVQLQLGNIIVDRV